MGRRRTAVDGGLPGLAGKYRREGAAAAQVEVAASLHAGEKSGTFERMYLAHELATLYWYYSRHDDAINLLESALAEFRRASDGVLPQSANDTLYKYVDYLSQRGKVARGEEVFLAEMKTAPNQQQRHWLVQQLYQLYNRAIANNGTVSLGKGQKLYEAAEEKICADISETKDHNHRYQVISTLTSIYRTAKEKNLNRFAHDLRRFAFEQLPEVLKRQTNNYQSIVQTVAGTLHDVASPRDGLAFLVERIENEPSWLRYQHQDGWSQHAWQLGEWRREVGSGLGDLEPRLLKVVLNELRRDLDSMQSRNRNLYQKHSGHYWAEKEQEFARVAEEVLERHMKSSAQMTVCRAVSVERRGTLRPRDSDSCRGARTEGARRIGPGDTGNLLAFSRAVCRVDRDCSPACGIAAREHNLPSAVDARLLPNGPERKTAGRARGDRRVFPRAQAVE